MLDLWNGPGGYACRPQAASSSFLGVEPTLDNPSLPSQPVDVESIFNFNDVLYSKIWTAEEMVNPLIESDNELVLAISGVNNHMSTGHGSTCSVSGMSLVDLPSPPSYDGKHLFSKNPFTSKNPSPNPPYETMGLLPCRMGTHVLEDNYFPAAQPLSGNYAADSLVSMNDSRHDINGFLSQAMSSAQMMPGASEAQNQSNVHALSTVPYILPIQPSHTEETQMNDLFSTPNTQFQPLFSTAPATRSIEPSVKVVAPVITKDTVAQTGLASVSLSMATGNSMMVRRSISSESPSTITEMDLMPTKKPGAQRLYECPTCFKVFHRAYNRKLHMTTHEAIEKRLRPFKCSWPECGKQFARKHDMNRHYLGVHLKARKNTTGRTRQKHICSTNTSPSQ